MAGAFKWEDQLEEPATAAAPQGFQWDANPEEPVGVGDALVRGLAQGETADFADELLSAEVLAKRRLAQGVLAAMKQGPGAGFRALMAPGARDAYREMRDSLRAGNAQAREQKPLAYGAGQVLGALATAPFVPGGGAKLSQMVMQGAGLGATSGLGASEAELTEGDPGQVARALLDTGAGGLLGAGAGLVAGGIGKLLGKASQAAAQRASDIEQKVGAQAAETAAAGTATARGAAGRAAQDAYRQLEHLRELGAMRALTSEEAQVAASLERELAEKAQQKLLPAAAEKAAKAVEYQQAMATEAQRAQQLASEKLSGTELLRQIGARLKRYGPAAVGGALGGALLPGIGAPMGAASALVLRPAIHSLRRLAQQPVVQRGLAKAAASLGAGAERAVEGAAGPVERALAPDLERGLLPSILPTWALTPGEEARLREQLAQAEALRQ